MEANARKGIFAVIAAVVIQFTLGIIYIWSVFQTGIADKIFDGNNASAGLVFSLVLMFFGVGGIFGGKLATKFSVRMVVFIGGIIISVGTFIASFTQPEFGWLLWVSYGVMGGLGMGVAYTTTIAAAQKWYPHKKGLITGIIVGALGFGGVIFTPIIEWLIETFGGFGMGELNTLMVLSGVFLVVCTVGSIFMVTPPEGYLADKVTKTAVRASTRDYSPKEMLKTPECYLLILAFIFSVVAGLMMINFARPIAIARGLEHAATIGVLAIALFNSVGRLFWGTISDRIGRIPTLVILLVISGSLALLVNIVSGYVIFVVIAAIGFSFGGILTTFPALTSDTFGAKFMAGNYGYILLGFGTGAIVASQIGGHFKNIADTYGDISYMFPAFVIAAIFSALGIATLLILRALTKKKSTS